MQMDTYRQPTTRSEGTTAREQNLTAYTVQKGHINGHDYWTRIGKALPNSDGNGFTILLSALPADAKIVIRRESPRAAKGLPTQGYRA